MTPKNHPKVLRIGFSGSRFPFPPTPKVSSETETSPGRAAAVRLGRILGRLPEMLGLPWDQPMEGVSQIAIGADTHFADACAALGLPHRIFLPQKLSLYLNATDDSGTADFDPTQMAGAENLLKSPRIAEVRVVGLSDDRETRFAETNRAIIAASDVLVCLVRANAPGWPGGALEFMEMAREAGKPLCEIRLSLIQTNPVFRETLHRFP